MPADRAGFGSLYGPVHRLPHWQPSGGTAIDKFDRIFQLHAILASRRTPIPLEDLLARLECSKATLHRTIATMRTYLSAPIVATSEGYKYAQASGTCSYELPGLWFTAAELQALAILQRLLTDIGGGLLEEHLGPISTRLDELIKHQKLNLGEAAGRLRFPAIAARPVGPAFQVVASATLQRRKLWLQYHSRSNDERTDRVVSPQRIIHYRESWYLDVWDESRDSLRTFSVDRISRPTILEERARDIPEHELEEHYASAYGIFGGKADKIAVLRFSRQRARWVASECWHPRQQGTLLADGRYELRIPYRNPTELVMDILRHGKDVEVIEPQTLRDEVVAELQMAMELYRSDPVS